MWFTYIFQNKGKEKKPSLILEDFWPILFLDSANTGEQSEILAPYEVSAQILLHHLRPS